MGKLFSSSHTYFFFSSTLLNHRLFLQYAELNYSKRNRHLGTFSTIEQAFFANAFARELALATDDLQMSEEEARENVKLIKTKTAEVLSHFVEGTRQETPTATAGRESPLVQEHCPFRTVGVKKMHSGQWVSLCELVTLSHLSLPLTSG